MIFKDYFALWDTSKHPGTRQDDDKCLNCCKGRFSHYGWSCVHPGRIFFDDVPRSCCYITQSMLDSIGMTLEQFRVSASSQHNPTRQPPSPPVVVKPMPDTPQWKTSLKVSMRWGECPCGIDQQDCQYHR